MTRRGPKKQVSDLRLLFELHVAGEYTFASEIQERVALDAVQSVRDRLNTLVDETDFVERKKVSGRNLYRLTDDGESHLLAQLRSRIE